MSGAATDIAVIGMSCRFPGVPDLEAYWRLLLEGRSTVGTFPARRAAPAGRPPRPPHPDAATVGHGSFFDTVDGFDAAFFDIGPVEAAAMDPVQRLGLELAWEAVEDARIAADSLAGRRIDVVVGAAPSGYELLRRDSGSDRDDHYAALGSGGALIANRISYLLDLRGTSLCADTGQSSSLVALALACDRIRGGAVDTALAGGVNLIVDPEAGLPMANLGALSPDGRCYTFDARASGFVRGEGGAFVLLKRLDRAVADGDRIHAVVRGWSTGSGGASSRMPDPSPGAQTATVQAALDDAAVPFDDIDYIEAHGTGTRLGDPAELAGLREILRRTGRSRPLAIGSVKTNIGHLEPAAGIAGFVKAALCVDRARLVPTLNFRSPNPAVPDFARDFEVHRTARPWPDPPGGRPRRAGVSAFGMGGTNAHMILEQAPDGRAGAPDGRSDTADGRAGAVDGGATAPRTAPPGNAPAPWVLSARSEPALRAQAARLRALVAADPSLSAVDVGHSLVATRSLFEHRAIVLGGDRAETLAGLDAVAAGENTPRVVRGTAEGPVGPVVFVFPGQGSQWLGMGRRLYAESAPFARSIDDCARALEPWLDWSLLDLVTDAPSAPSLDQGDAVVQPALFAMMVSLSRVWRSLGVVPDAVVGHSQGEIAAACAAGALSLDDAARIVALRSRALTELAGIGGLHAVSAPREWVDDRLGEWPGRLTVAAVNGPGSVVIAGDLDALDRFAAMAEGAGVRTRRVRIDYASHSPHVERIRDRVIEAVGDVSPRRVAVEFHSTVTGGPLDADRLDGAYWYDNLRSTVRFGEVVERLMRDRGGVFVEVSPHPVLTVAMAETADALDAGPLIVGTLDKNDGGADRILQSLAELHVRGVPVNWEAVYAGDRPRRVGLPTYAFQRQRHWLTAPDDTATPGTSGTSGMPETGGSGAVERPSEATVLDLVCAEAAAVLSTGDTRLTGADLAARSDRTFKELGFDSSTAVRLRNRLTAAAGVRLPATVAFTHPTPRALGRHLFSLLVPEEPDPSEQEAEAGRESRSDDELYELIDRGYV
ncbi:type I polyketide synthase [Streptomyces sp. NPDC059248]|uniref:type I polyketide synthase n=1 Tax=Streptomyces sp. NPDC059248 TaxID=3346791 RepID=UPI0036942BDD